MGRRKISPENKRQTICIKLKPEMLAAIQMVSEERIISMSKVIEICLDTATSIHDLENGIELTNKSVMIKLRRMALSARNKSVVLKEEEINDNNK